MKSPQTLDWQTILWREWRHAEDAAYARHLYDLLADEPLAQRHRLALGMLGAIWGASAGGLIDLVWLAQPLLIGLGGLMGGLAGFWWSQRLTMRRWLALLSPHNPFKTKRGIIGFLLPLVVMGLLSLIGPPGLSIAGVGLGMLAGVLLGLIWAGIIGPLLWLLSMLPFQAGVLTGLDLVAAAAAVGLGLGLGGLFRSQNPMDDNYAHRGLFFWWRRPPTVSNVLAALRQAVVARPEVDHVWDTLLHQLHGTRLDSPESYINALAHPDWQKRSQARIGLLTWGAEAIKPLIDLTRQPGYPLRHTTYWLLRSIEQDTTTRYHEQTPLCTDCLRRWKAYVETITLETSLTYYACQACGHSKHAAYGEVVAVLDEAMTDMWRQEAGQVWVNWLQVLKPFDFDRVEIGQAGDEAVERFAVQIGNDLEPTRRSRYRAIPCRIASSSGLSANSARVLGKIFDTAEESEQIGTT